MRLLALSLLLLASACSNIIPTEPPQIATNTECYEGAAAPDTEVVGDNPETCAYQDGMAPEVDATMAMARLTVECDPMRVRVEVQRHSTEEFRQVPCNDDYPAELVCGWHTMFRITALDFGEGTAEVVIRSDCPVPDYGGVRCYGEAWPHANFGSTRGDCATGDTFVIDDIAAGDEIEAWADPID